ncbi:MAG: VpaChn25_0724 family phage protein [Dyella sp.]|uniref:VpaChn25_0724 family phage protein n=1 Tax=Dyella sp. TaxID=1869338 RepID=UPI003F7EC2FD
MSMQQQQTEFRRGRILKILAESNDQGANVPLVRTLVREFGYKADQDTVKIDLAWLSRHGFITVREVGEIELARITASGRDIVSRDLDVPGVQMLDD